jgi:hypothetical protein
MRAEVEHVRAIRPDDVRALSKHVLDRICARLDELGGAWSKLAIGESFLVPWSHDARRRRRP